MSDIFLCLFYFLIFSVIILRSKWFKAGGFNNIHFLFLFYLKLLFGVGLWLLYTHYYKNRVTSDIFKYYDDAKMAYDTLPNIKDYLTMLTGIGDSGTHYQALYQSMNSWNNKYGSILYNNSHFIIRLNAFFLLLSHGCYGVHVIFMCFIALVGLTYIYKAFLPFLTERSKELFAAVFLFPSVILWSSGILKEGLVWFGLGLSIYYFFQLLNTSAIRLKYILCVFIGFLLLYETKAYSLLCLLPCFIAQFLLRKTAFFNTLSRPGKKDMRTLVTYAFVFIMYMVVVLLPHAVFHTASPLQMISDKQNDFNRISKGGIYLENIKHTNIKPGNEFAFISVADSTGIIPLTSHADSLLHKNGIQYLASNPVAYKEWTRNAKIPFILKKGISFSRIIIGSKDTLHLIASDSTTYWIYTYIETANSRIKIEPIKPNIVSLVSHIPQALNVSLLLPYPWQLRSAMTAIYCAENIFVFMLFFIALFFFKRPVLHQDFALFCLTYSLMMLVLIGLVSPILGGIERYKSVVIPFMFILLLLTTDKDKISNVFKLKK